MRRTVLPLTVALVVAPLFVMAPAQAATPVIGALDSSTPGHVTGTVTSSTLFVRVELHANNQSHALSDEVLRPVIAGSATYDLETWGLTTG